jgi:hypothetical protein
MKKILLTLLLTGFLNSIYAQGVSFSYLIPKNGYLSAPISPFSLRGIGFGNNAGIETGFSLYNIPGLSMDNLPFESDKPLTGPHLSVLVPLELYFKVPVGSAKIKLSAGGFGWWNITSKLNEGNFDRAYRAYFNYQVINTDLTLKNKIGYGLLGGIDFEFPINREVSINVGGHYLKGGINSSLNGDYIGVDKDGQIINGQIDINDATVVLDGLELSFGVQF